MPQSQTVFSHWHSPSPCKGFPEIQGFNFPIGRALCQWISTQNASIIPEKSLTGGYMSIFYWKWVCLAYLPQEHKFLAWSSLIMLLSKVPLWRPLASPGCSLRPQVPVHSATMSKKSSTLAHTAATLFRAFASEGALPSLAHFCAKWL